MNQLKISVLTPSYNQGNYIERNILSVLSQGYSAFEHIVVDGGSGDNTVEILEKYPHLKWVSEKDNGQADALNKGIKMSDGSIIGWINSDDFYAPDIFREVAKEFENPEVQWVIGNICKYYEDTKKAISVKSERITHFNLLKNPDIVKQPATFFRKSFIEKGAGWDASMHMIMDFDLWLRLSKISTPKMVDKYWAFFTVQSEQKSAGKNLMRQWSEMRLVMQREGAPTFLILKVALKKYIYLIKFFIKDALIKMGLISAKYRHLNFINRNEC